MPSDATGHAGQEIGDARRARQRFNVSFSPNLALNSFIQYVDTEDLISMNTRFNWIYKPGADLFIVYNQSTNTDRLPGEPQTNFRQGIVKLTWMFQF